MPPLFSLSPLFPYLLPIGVLNMGFIPRDRRQQAMLRRQLGKDLPIVVFRSGPVPVSDAPSRVVGGLCNFSDAPWHEIDSKAELVRTLPRSRFRGAFGEKVTLPVDTAETLERFEKELRSVGLIRKGEVLRQGAKLKSHFRVQVLGAVGNTLDVHELSSLKNAHSGPLSGVGERATKSRCSEPKPLLEAVQPKGLPFKGRRCIRVKGGLPPT